LKGKGKGLIFGKKEVNMPIFEFNCDNCGSQWEILVLGSEQNKPQKCPKCGGELKRMMSAFASLKGQATPLRTASQSCGSSTGFS